MRWYTAVGVKMEHLGGLFCVQVGTENKILSGMEIFILESTKSIQKRTNGRKVPAIST